MDHLRLHKEHDCWSDGRLPSSPWRVAPPTHDLTIIIPAYNEEQRLPWTLAELAVFLGEWGIDYHVVVADDGSTDRTATLTRELGPRYSTLRLVPHGGKGRAVRAAMLRATGRIVAYTDANLPFRLEAIRQGYEWLRANECDVVYGARDIEGAESLVSRKVLRRFASFLFSEIVRCLISHEITDTLCGLKLFHRQAALELFGRQTIDGFAFDTEIVMWTQRLGLRYKRVPVKLVQEYASSPTFRRNVFPMLYDVLKMKMRENMGGSAASPQFIYDQAAEPATVPPRKAA